MNARKPLSGLRKVLVRMCTSAILGLVLSLWPLSTTSGSESSAPSAQEAHITPSQLIQAVNNLRLSHGLHALSVHSILMGTAQQQANALLSSDGAVGHTRPGGMDYTGQLLSLGYPLAGDLSMGGYRSENWLYAYPGMTVDQAIQMWLGDGPHTNTMLSPNYEDIGTGTAYASDGSGYLVIDTAMPTASGKPQNTASQYTPGNAPGTFDPSQWIQPVVLSTARPDGDVVHEVKYGQSLWGIAIAYNTRIREIQRLNNIQDEIIYTGQILLVLKGATQPAPPPSETSEVTPTPRHSRTAAPTPTASPTQNPPTGTPTLLAGKNSSKSPPIPPSVGLSLKVVGGIFVASMILSGIISLWSVIRGRGEETIEG